MKTGFKALSFVLALVLMLGCSVSAFAAEIPATEIPVEVNESQKNAVVLENSETTVSPRMNGDYITFKVGNIGYMSSCGFTPKFKIWVTGGDANTQVAIHIKTAGGIQYGPFGPVKANGSNYLEKPFVVYNSGGAWQFTAAVTSGTNNGNLTVHVQQIY